jgi:lipoate-protein ligase A
MGEDQLGVALAISGKADETYAHVRERMTQFSQGIISGLATLGIHVEFRRKNDLEVNGKKLPGWDCIKLTLVDYCSMRLCWLDWMSRIC